MSNSLNPGIGAHTPDQRRMADHERFIGQFQKTTIIAKDATGKDQQFEVLAILSSPAKAAASATYGSFFRLYAKNRDTYLQGGTVSGGSGSETIADIKVLDGKTVSGTLIGKLLWVEIVVNGVASDGVLLPGANVISARCSVTSTVGNNIPPNTLPTASSPSGKRVFVEIGRWTKEGFYPATSGSIQVSFCPGSFTINR